MNTRELETGKRIVEMSRSDVFHACRLYCNLANMPVPKHAELFKLGSYNKATGLQFEYAVSDDSTYI